MRDFSEDLADLARRVQEAQSYLGIDDARSRLTALEAEVSAPELWDDPDRARKVSGEFAAVRDDVDLVDGLASRVSDVQTLYELGRDEGDASVEPEIAAEVADLRTALDKLELRALFSESPPK